jgi:hypothetical protein
MGLPRKLGPENREKENALKKMISKLTLNLC